MYVRNLRMQFTCRAGEVCTPSNGCLCAEPCKHARRVGENHLLDRSVWVSYYAGREEIVLRSSLYPASCRDIQRLNHI